MVKLYGYEKVPINRADSKFVKTHFRNLFNITNL